MLGIERLRYIHTQVERNSAVKVDELSKELQVSPITIRRDLKTLEEQGKLTRTHGGAVSTDNILVNEEKYDDKLIHTHGAKTAMARRCLELIPDHSMVILDAGTSTYEVARSLRLKKNITAVTCDLRIASDLYQSGIHTYITGGEIQSGTGAIFGSATEQFISGLRADVGIIGVAGISPNGILYTPTMSKTNIKQFIIKSSIMRILLADSVKFDVSSRWEICPLSAFDYIVTDAHFSPREWEERGVDPQRVRAITPDVLE